jgi:hypothetical protein
MGCFRVQKRCRFCSSRTQPPNANSDGYSFRNLVSNPTVWGLPATFLKEGLGGVVADPFGSSLFV